MEIAENPVTGRLSHAQTARRYPRDDALRGRALAKLGLLERMLVTSDGTVTVMLEQMVGEAIVTAGLEQSVAPVETGTADVLPFPVDSLLTRATQLVGVSTGTVYVWATSVFSPAALPERVRAGLLKTDEPIGRLLRRERVESFREILSIEVPDDSGPAEPRRRYIIRIGGSPAVHIEEIFTANCFTAWRAVRGI